MIRTALAFAAMLACVPALALAAEAPTFKLNLKGLDLTTDDGAKAALARIGAAADKACRDDMVGSRIGEVDQACRKGMVESAVRQLKSPKVTELYGAQPDRAASDRRGGRS